MNFFNIDLHISVIADLRGIFGSLGHSITDKSLSGHTWVFGKSPDSLDVISHHNWRDLSPKMCDEFYNRYNDELGSYDGFICTYPPAFSLLYEKFNKPIIIQAPIRLEVPFENNPAKLDWFASYLQKGIDSKQIIPIANSMYDKKYCEEFTSREWRHIPSLCEYTNTKYSPNKNDFIIFSHNPVDTSSLPLLTKAAAFGSRPYSWPELYSYKGIVHLPYQVSTMSIFEQYTANVPLFFPTLSFLMDLYKRGLVLQELSWNNFKKDSEEWLQRADYYDPTYMKNIQYFGSFRELRDMLYSVDLQDISRKMEEENLLRKSKVMNKWNEVLCGF